MLIPGITFFAPALYWRQVLLQCRVKRKEQAQITCFLNNMGLGLQFAAVANLVYQKAQAAGLGRILPPEWFTEDVHP